MEWEKTVKAGVIRGEVSALTPHTRSSEGLITLIHRYSLMTSGSHAGKAKHVTMRRVPKNSVQSAVNTPYNSQSTRTTNGKSGAEFSLVPSQMKTLNKRVGAVASQVVQLVEGATRRDRRVMELTAEFVVQSR